MKKIMGWIYTALIVFSCWIIFVLVMGFIAASIWTGKGADVPILYALAVVFAPIVFSFYCGIKFKKAYEKKHGKISPCFFRKDNTNPIKKQKKFENLSSAVMIVNSSVQETPDDHTATVDKTYEEIKTAVENGKVEKKYTIEKPSVGNIVQLTPGPFGNQNDIDTKAPIGDPSSCAIASLTVEDEMLPAAVDVILETNFASVPMIQRHLNLGYARAARIIDEMEEKGIVGPFRGSKPRQILITKAQWKKTMVNIEVNQETPTIISSVPSTDFFYEKDILSCVDNMEGHEFESWCAELLRSNGFSDVQVTRGSGDQGVDILAKKDGIKYAIQCKCYCKDLGNRPVQEVNAGKAIYHCQIGVVMTNRYFTQGAKDAAEATGILLWDRDKLQRFVSEAAKLGKEI